MIDTLVAGGEVVTATDRFRADVAVADGLIAGVGAPGTFPEAETVLDASGQLVMPGVVDPHVHVDEVPESRAGTYAAETAAAAVGGVTTVVDFAFQGGDRAMSDDDADLLDGIAHKRAKGADACVDFGLHGVLWRETGDSLDEIPRAVEAGVTSFKTFFSNYEIGVSTGFVDRVFGRVADEGAVALVHTENPSVCDAHAERLKREGKGAPRHYPESRPDYAEAMAAEDAARMAVEAGTQYYGVHTTCEAAADVLAEFADVAADPDGEGGVRAETCVHYAVHDDSVYDERGNLAKLAPPIRSAADREALFDALQRRDLSVVSTDHAVYHEEYKRVDDWWDAPLGVNGLQHSLALFHEVAVNERDFSYPDLVDLMCATPARTFGLPAKGTLDPGTDADLVVFDPDREYTIDAADNYSNATYSVYDGITVQGRPTRTLLGGEVIAADGEHVGEPGDGEFLARECPEWDR